MLISIPIHSQFIDLLILTMRCEQLRCLSWLARARRTYDGVDALHKERNLAFMIYF